MTRKVIGVLECAAEPWGRGLPPDGTRELVSAVEPAGAIPSKSTVGERRLPTGRLLPQCRGPQATGG